MSVGSWGELHSLTGEGVWEPNSDEGTVTLILYVYYNPSKLYIMFSKMPKFELGLKIKIFERV
jgi:hypothetical protein